MASFQGPFTDLLEHFCDFSSCKCLEYCLKEPTTNYEGLNIGYWQFISINILYCTYGTFGPFLLYIRTTVRIINKKTTECIQEPTCFTANKVHTNMNGE